MKHSFFHLTKGNQIDFFLDGPDYYSRYIELIKNAKHSIHLQTYIFELDEFGTLVHTELIKASKRGVNVFLLVDSIGSRLLTHKSEEELKSSGIHFQRFNSIQIKWLYSWGRRLHHKVLLIDEEISFVGGINVTSIYDPETHRPQLDFAVLIKGPVITRLTQYCQVVFKKAIGVKKLSFPAIKTPSHFHEGFDIKILVNDWVYRRWQITKQYTRLTKEAKQEITIINSYFFPRKAFMRQLVAASERGVKVRLILPKFSDWPSYILASEFLYAYCLKNGIEIYQWKKSILHGKLAIIDDDYTTIGSFNLNYTSYQQNLEMNVNIYSKHFTNTMKNKVENLILTGCEKIDPHDFIQNCSLKVKAQRFFYYIILSLIANFSIAMTYQEEPNQGNKLYNIVRIIGAIFFFILGIIGAVLPIIPGIPFFIISFLLVYKQILLNRNKDSIQN